MHWAYSVFGVDDVTPFKIRCISLHQRIIKKLLYVVLNILLHIPPRTNNFKPKTREICTDIIKTTWCTEIRQKKIIYSYIFICSDPTAAISRANHLLLPFHRRWCFIRAQLFRQISTRIHTPLSTSCKERNTS